MSAIVEYIGIVSREANGADVEYRRFTVDIPMSVIDPIHIAFNPDSATSPNAADSRTIARPFVEKMRSEGL